MVGDVAFRAPAIVAALTAAPEHDPDQVAAILGEGQQLGDACAQEGRAARLRRGAPALAQKEEQRGELLAEPKYAEDPAAPSFERITPDELERSLVVVSSRNYAFFGFNTPEVQLHLPPAANSTYAEVDLREPRLIDATGSDVPYELERGLHDAETQIAEIRFLAEGGDAAAEFARVQGEIVVRYPLAVGTRVVTADGSDEVVSVDGPFVEILEGAGVAEAPSFSPLEPVRAFDAEGRQLARAFWSSSRFEHGQSWRGLAFHGAVARVEVDAVETWASAEIAYDIPIAPTLPESRLGQGPRDPRAVNVAGDIRVEVAVVPAGEPAPDPGPLPGVGDQVPVAAPTALSEEARWVSRALVEIEAALPGPPSIVQLVVSPPARVSISSQTPHGVQQWTCATERSRAPPTWRRAGSSASREWPRRRCDSSGSRCCGTMRCGGSAAPPSRSSWANTPAACPTSTCLSMGAGAYSTRATGASSPSSSSGGSGTSREDTRAARQNRVATSRRPDVVAPITQARTTSPRPTSRCRGVSPSPRQAKMSAAEAARAQSGASRATRSSTSNAGKRDIGSSPGIGRNTTQERIAGAASTATARSHARLYG